MSDRKPLLFAVAAAGASVFLATREDGATDRKRLGTLLDAAHPVGALTLDFTGVAAMTLLYADEFLGRFYTSLAAGDVDVQGVRLVGLNEETRYTLDVVLTRRRLCGLDGDQDTLLGYTTVLEATYRAARRFETFTAMELAETLGLAATAMNNRLTRLAQAGALVRELGQPAHGGREYAYRAGSAQR